MSATRLAALVVSGLGPGGLIPRLAFHLACLFSWRVRPPRAADGRRIFPRQGAGHGTARCTQCCYARYRARRNGISSTRCLIVTIGYLIIEAEESRSVTTGELPPSPMTLSLLPHSLSPPPPPPPPSVTSPLLPFPPPLPSDSPPPLTRFSILSPPVRSGRRAGPPRPVDWRRRRRSSGPAAGARVCEGRDDPGNLSFVTFSRRFYQFDRRTRPSCCSDACTRSRCSRSTAANYFRQKPSMDPSARERRCAAAPGPNARTMRAARAVTQA